VANQLIDDVLSSADIVDIINRYVPLKRAGSNFSWCCPFHNEKTPSFMVSPTKQIFKCFGCWKGGNVLTFIQEIERIDFWDAVKELAKIENINLEKYDTTVKKIAADSDEKWKIKRIHSLTQQFFKSQLQNSSEAQSYLKEKRKLTDQLIEQFGIWYAPDKNYELIQLLRSKGFTDNDLLEASLAKKGATWEIFAFFRNRITFPIFDIMGNVVGFSARVLKPEDSPKYLNSAEHKAFEKSKILYGLNFAKNGIKEHQKIIIVEWQMDVLGLAKLGIPIGVATSWTSLTDEHVKILKRYTENIYLMFDNDNAGQQATQRALKLFYQQNIFPKIISIPQPRKDIDEISNEENGKTIFEECLWKAKDGFIVLYERLRTTLDMSSPIDKQKLINNLFDVILSVDSLAIQEHYKWVLSEKLGFAYTILDAQFKRYKSTDWRLQVMQNARKHEQEHIEKFQLEREWLFATIFYQDLIKKYLWDYEKIAPFIQFVQLLTKTDTESIYAKTINNTLDEKEKEKIEELTLRRDQQLEPFSENQTRYQHIFQTLQPYIQTLLQLALKNPNISGEDKTELLKLRKNL